MAGYEQCSEKKIYSLPIFQDLGAELLQSATFGNDISVQHHNDFLFTAGEPADFFGFVLEGTYKLSIDDENGDDVILHFGTSGEALGIMSVMNGPSLFPFHAISIGTSRFLKIPKTTFTNNWLQSSELMFRFQNELQGRIFRAHEEKRQQRLELPQRVANLFIYLSNYKSSCASQISIQLTRKDIANYVGASIESVIRLISDWTSKGIVRTENRSIYLLDFTKLQQIARGNWSADLNDSTYKMSHLDKLWSKTSLNKSVKKIYSKPS